MSGHPVENKEKNNVPFTLNTIIFQALGKLAPQFFGEIFFLRRHF